MNKKSILIMALVLVFVFVACGNNNVTLKIPSQVLEDEGNTGLDEYADKKGFISVTQISNMYIEVTMTKSKHREIVRGMKKTVEDRFSGIVGADGTEYIKKITHDKDFKNITVVVDKTGYENASHKITYDMDIDQIGLLSVNYQIYTGIEQRAEVIIIDANTKDILSTYIYPDVKNN